MFQNLTDAEEASKLRQVKMLQIKEQLLVKTIALEAEEKDEDVQDDGKESRARRKKRDQDEMIQHQKELLIEETNRKKLLDNFSEDPDVKKVLPSSFIRLQQENSGICINKARERERKRERDRERQQKQ